MIVQKITYGIAITDRHGDPLTGLAELVAQIIEPWRESTWRVTCFSAQNPQFVLGIEAKISKYTDFDALHRQWEQSMATAPQKVRDLMAKLPLAEPDVVFLAGHL